MDGPNFDIELFLKEVKCRPVLWDSRHPHFNHRQGKKSAWEEVAMNVYADSESWSNYDKFGKVKDVQKRWKNMRDTYIKELRYERKVEQGLAVAKRKKYMYAHLMDFLSPWKKPPINKSSSEKSSSEDEGMEAEQHTKQSESYTLMDEGYSSSHVNQFCKVSMGPQLHFESVQSSPEQHASKASPTGISPITSSTVAQCVSKPNFPGDNRSESSSTPLEYDDDKMFLLSLLPYFKKFGEERKLQARINVTKLLHEMLYLPS